MSKTPTRQKRKTNRLPILVIEGNADQWLIIRAVLNQCFPEVEPIWLNHAMQAKAYIETQVRDNVSLPLMVLMDWYLPAKSDGFNLLEFIKTHPSYKKLPVIIVSDSAAREDMEFAYNFSIASYLIKPGSFHDWLNCFYTFRRYWWETVSLHSR
ncbi:response regulator [Spirosoma lituiforme]|nr:MAG: response regulator [Cytophagaceae bacterium]